jgi:hypothetical protein
MAMMYGTIMDQRYWMARGSPEQRLASVVGLGDSMGKGKAAGRRFDSATHAWEIMAHGGIQRGSRSNGR